MHVAPQFFFGWLIEMPIPINGTCVHSINEYGGKFHLQNPVPKLRDELRLPAERLKIDSCRVMRNSPIIINRHFSKCISIRIRPSTSSKLVALVAGFWRVLFLLQKTIEMREKEAQTEATTTLTAAITTSVSFLSSCIIHSARVSFGYCFVRNRNYLPSSSKWWTWGNRETNGIEMRRRRGWDGEEEEESFAKSAGIRSSRSWEVKSAKK